MLRAGRNELSAELRLALMGPCGVPAGAPVVLGVSGGPDSLALLFAAAVLGRRTRSAAIRPFVVHVDHHLRPDSGADARFVVRRCAEIGVPCEVADVRPAERSGNRHAAARELRYAALVEAAWRVGAAFVATAHHADDQLETILMALCRGAGLDGLAGMPWRRELGSGVQLVRPMLGVTKRRCEMYCRTIGVRWRVDPGNSDERRTRGRLRRDVLPALEAIWPGAAVRVQATADIVAAARDRVEATLPACLPGRAAAGARTVDSIEFDREALRGLARPIAALAIRRAAVCLRPAATDAIDAALCRAAAELALGPRRRGRIRGPDGLSIVAHDGTIALSAVRASSAAPESNPLIPGS